MSENSSKSNTAKFLGLTVSCVAVCAVSYFLEEPKVLWGILAVGMIFNWASD